MPKFVNLIAFLQKLISKEHIVVITEFPDWVQVKMKILYLLHHYELLSKSMVTCVVTCWLHVISEINS